jgi:hypothetical protein
MGKFTREALQERRASIQAELDRTVATVNVLIGRRSECDHWLAEMEEAAVSSQESGPAPEEE